MSTSTTTPTVPGLRARLDALMVRDQRALGRRLAAARRERRPHARRSALERLAAAVDSAELRLRERADAVPPLHYPEALPVSQRREDILAAIHDHQVVIVAGETGSGKTTQLPKICLELGRGVRGLIGHTQPRRIAARSVAERLAEETGTVLGGAIGYQVRFTDQAGERTLVKLMTDGILLAEIQGDPDLERYDTIIIDEAHERSLNIDFLLGYLARLLPRRPDLKLVITSATIDPERFSRHFGDAPVVEVSGRTFPVEIRYHPLEEAEDDPEDPAAGGAPRAAGRRPASARSPGDQGAPRNSARPRGRRGRDDETPDQIQGICEAVEELCAEGPGDILVFLSGEREIRDTADAMARLTSRGLDVLPLYARLSMAEQHRVFAAHPGRRVVLATNIAETSLTVPGIRYVVDPGTARISRYSHRAKVQRLPIEKISRASADQRAGRCGRVAEGVCIRLYSEEDHLARQEFTDPEILRTNLASVILRMAALGLGDVADFPFVDPPDHRQIRDGLHLLFELGALDKPEQGKSTTPRLTPLGRRLAQLPVDPRLGRMVLEADRNGCLREVTVIAAALSIQDPRERPADAQQAADTMHARFADPDSDFVSYLRLWNHVHEQQKALSSSQFRRMCRREYLNYLRIREWQDLYGQIRQIAATVGVSAPGPRAGFELEARADRDRIHQSLMAGLLSHIGTRVGTTQEYAGARNTRFAIFPGSVLFRTSPPWVMAAELVETSRLWGRVVAAIEPERVEEIAAHLVRRTYSEPRWDRERGAVLATEKVTLYGVPLVAARTVGYGRVDPPLARELFIRHALVEGDWDTHHRFFRDNAALFAQVEKLQDRLRRRDVLVDDETVYGFYDERIPASVVSARHFDSWWKRARHESPGLLDLSLDRLIAPGAGVPGQEDFPDRWQQGELSFRLSYRFDPGSADDGVTIHLPLSVLNRVREEDFGWNVPGVRLELVTALMRSLPKALRRTFVPVPDHAARALAELGPPDGSLLETLARHLTRVGGVTVPTDAWDLERVPDHLRPTFRVEGARGQVLAQGKDLGALRYLMRDRLQATISRAATRIEREGLRRWDLGSLPRTFEQPGRGQGVHGYPSLVDTGDSVAVRVLGTPQEQRRCMREGVRRLLLLEVSSPVASVLARLDNREKLSLSRSPHGSATALFDDCLRCAVDSLVDRGGGVPWDPEAYTALRESVRASLPAVTTDVMRTVARILGVWHELERHLGGTRSPALLPTLDDVRQQVAGLVYPGFVTATGAARLGDVHRYVRAALHRLEKAPENPARDADRMDQVHRVEDAYREAWAAAGPDGPVREGLASVRWLAEEFRVSLFAQVVKAACPVSEKRIMKAIQEAEATARK